ncbi:hypothetical protein HPP92_011715 [Vanilla planifolia]|uniref:Pentatricopeptide repeat-containing protein n=1 Tax=Vanilla planifolia TaxID=51239 RepID=A0A835R6J7_VANPL|nr:hypothetical protein HPP92_011715 [Vanilla planifolia]
MVAGYASQGLANEGERLVVKMRSCGVKPDLVTWNSLISGYAQSGNEQKAMELLDHMRSTGIQPDAFSWTSLISGSVRSFEYENAFALFRQMVSMAGIRPTSATISSLLPASSNVMNLSRGKEIHCYSVAIGVVHDLYVSSSLVDMYAKCGLLSDAEKMFDDMLLRNTVSCNSMIFAYASHGQCEKAIQLYSDMKMYCAKPDYLTFTALLTACSHSGMVEFGSELFRSMQEDYAISPRMEHYACMVDLLGRAGRLREAYSFICGMRVQPNSSVWRALLGACRLHGEAEMAYIAERCLHELKPGRRPLPFKMLRAEELGDVLKVRQLGKKRMRRYKGCSWTQAASAAKLKRSGPCTLRQRNQHIHKISCSNEIKCNKQG